MMKTKYKKIKVDKNQEAIASMADFSGTISVNEQFERQPAYIQDFIVLTLLNALQQIIEGQDLQIRTAIIADAAAMKKTLQLHPSAKRSEIAKRMADIILATRPDGFTLTRIVYLLK